ncbi:hypothetical protein GF356_06180 [candidate division GN15 bacterium]|nr:hypothetical protein [candidate division GN15 bacterium]
MFAHLLVLTITLAVATLAGAVDLNGDDSNSVAIGDRVRIDYDTTINKRILLLIPYSQTEGREVSGELVAYDTDSLTLASPLFESGVHRHEIANVTRMYVSVGKKRATWKGLKSGALVGASLGLLIGCAPDAVGDTTLLFHDRAHPLEVIAVSTAIGAAIGTLIGSFMTVDRWQEVDRRHWPVGSAAVGVDVARRQFMVSLRF